MTSTRGRDERGVGAGDRRSRAGRARRRSRATSSMFCGLEPEVELLGDGLGEQLDQRRRVGQRGDRDAADEERRQPRHDLEVGVHERGHRRPLHLDHDPLAGDERGGVDLGDRRGGERARGRSTANTSSSGRPSSASMTARTSDHVLGRHLVAALLALVDQLLGEEALARRDDLGELDVGRAEVLGGDAQAAGEVGLGLAAALPAGAERPRGRWPGPRWRTTVNTRVPDGKRRGGDQLGHLSRGSPSGRRRPVARHGHGRRVDDPRRVVAERADREVGGRVGPGLGTRSPWPAADAVGRGVRRSAIVAESTDRTPQHPGGHGRPSASGARAVWRYVSRCWTTTASSSSGSGWRARPPAASSPTGAPTSSRSRRRPATRCGGCSACIVGHGQPESPPFDLDNRGKR